ncbi:succinate-semialdehyde dehydrogenase / glutarate-semialdehyde dehydrogenase [Devosia crocina]|uniref:Succinate-semialdehyde dehydrogenase / glutarate-semialdehyde dehydrogenase n=1 Tax=Devosia crocina TaxID=429728 RepID=A0A1I7MYM3_9HYPH|nr:NAD-dependent succinate-semialdehyde dehydrogenase [Devosia crocina]SFV27520.1 succinate-semialdehyde dehydrogenase / glutarate-semialdehyde dehydrogenase [Devosia crocina]
MAISNALSSRLSDPSLLVEAGFVGGTWCADAMSGERFEVTNPANGDVLASLPDLSRDEARAAIEAARLAQRDWSRKTGKQRAAILRQWHDLTIANADDLATILTTEMGKPLAEAKSEVLYGAGYIEWFAEEAKRIYGDVIPGHQEDKRIVVIKQPVGVVAAITPWNFPNAMVARKVAPALAAGCAIVLKPAAQTPLSSIALAILAERAGLPAGLFSVITTRRSRDFGAEITENPTVRKLTFTGSTEVGRALMAQAAPKIMKLSLELGGNAPFIVFDDADLDAAVEGAIVSKFRNAGQTCVCANRLYVQDGVHDAFAQKLSRRVAALKVADGFTDGVAIGPLVDDKALAKVEEHVADAVGKGAAIAVGGAAHENGGNFYKPTVLTGVTASMLVAKEETFGPLAPLFRFKDVEDVIAQANDTEFGLAAYFYAASMSRIWQVAEALECGMVGVNTGLISTEVAPFGGVKQSGFGREGSKYGLEDYLDIKYICLGGIDLTYAGEPRHSA